MAAAGSSKWQLVRLKKGKKTFEVMTNPGSVLKYRESGGKTKARDCLFADMIFKNQSKGDQAKEEDLVAAFGTKDVDEAVKVILDTGDLQVSASERKEALEKKRRELVAYLHRNYMDPSNNLPHPAARIELALDEAKKFHVDPEADVSKQAADFIKAMLGKLSFKKSLMEGLLTIPNASVGAAQGVVYKHADVSKTSHTQDGMAFQIGVTPGEWDAFLAALNKVTKGNYQFRSDNEAAAPAAADANEGGKKGKKKKGKKKKGGKN